MKEAVKKLAREWLNSQKVDLIYGLKEQDGGVAPHLFSRAEELDDLGLSNRQRLCHVCRPARENILALFQSRQPDKKIGVIARGCDERAVIELARRYQLDMKNISIMGVACGVAETGECRCDRPFPEQLMIGEKVAGHLADKLVEELLKKSLEERAAFWQHELNKCIKCYGCRNACPECFCHDCKLEQLPWVKTGRLPPEFPMFHFIRFYHLADRCTGCGACEKACPMDIPLLTIFRLMRKDIKELFDFEIGVDAPRESPLLTTSAEDPSKEGVKSA